MRGHRVYRALIKLYPASFRDRYGADVIAIFDEMCVDRGRGYAWRRAVLDLVITIPQYRLESVMSRARANTVVNAVIAAISAAAFIVVVDGAWPLSLVVLAAALVLAIGRRSRLARSLDPVVGRERPSRYFARSAVGALVLAGSFTVFLIDARDDHIGDGALVLYNLVGLVSLVAAVVCAFAGLGAMRRARRPAGV